MPALFRIVKYIRLYLVTMGRTVILVCAFYFITVIFLSQIPSSTINSMEAFGQRSVQVQCRDCLTGPPVSPFTSPSLGDRVPALKFNITNLVPIQTNGSITNTTAIRLHIDIVDSKTNQTFSWITYHIAISRVESNGTNTNADTNTTFSVSPYPVIDEFFLSQYGPLILDIEQPTTKEQQACLNPGTPSPCSSAINEDGALFYAQQDTYLNAFIENSTNGHHLSGLVPIVIKSPSLLEKGTYHAKIMMFGFDSRLSLYLNPRQAPTFNVDWSIGMDSLLLKAVPEFGSSVSALVIIVGIIGAVGAGVIVRRRML
jgi:hypothetical protein